MKKNLSAAVIVACILFFLPFKNFAQSLNLGVIEKCTIFSGNGAVTNSGSSTFDGIIGTDYGGLTGFNANATTYTTHSADAFTVQAKIDILNAFILLNNVPVTNITHAPGFAAETLTPGVYLVGEAINVSGSITLSGSATDFYIFKAQGALNFADGTTINLGNVLPENVFWLAEGAITATGTCSLAGTLIAHPGAVTLGSGSTLVGRALSTTGAINIGPGSATLPNGASNIPISCVITCDNPILGTAANYALFTGLGALTNAGVSGIIGKIGADGASSIDGFASSIVIGAQELNNTATHLAQADLLSAYSTLKARATTINHEAAFGIIPSPGIQGEILVPGVYNTSGVGSITGSSVVILDGGNNENSEFVFKIGGAFTAAAFSRVVLINGARRCNIFWVVTGAVTLGTMSFMKGNVINNVATGTSGQGFLEGRLLTTGGACAFNTSTTYISNSLCAGSMNNNLRVLPIQLLSFTAECYNQNITLKWATATEVYNKNFSVDRSNDGKIWELVGNVTGAGNSAALLNYSLVDNMASKNTTLFYRLKQTDLDNNFTYSKIISVAKCGAMEEDNLSFSPNPSSGQINFNFSGDKSQLSLTEIFNVQGEKVYQSNGYQSKINLANHAAGIYLVRVHFNSKIITRKIVVSK